MEPSPPDFGTFTLGVAEEAVLIVQLSEDAAKNKVKPGQAWARIEATRTHPDGRTEIAHKIFHVDLNKVRLTITEEWGGTLTARRTFTLGGASQPEEEPPPPLEPGQEEPTFRRRRFRSADLLPEEELRGWLLDQIETELIAVSVLPRRILLFGEGFREVVDMPRRFEQELAPGAGATLAALAGRPGVERRLVQGWLGSPNTGGRAWLIEVGEAEEWWLAERPFARRAGPVGEWTGTWSQRSGNGLAELPLALHPLLRPPEGEAALVLGAPLGPAPPQIAMAMGSLPPAVALPQTAEEVALQVGRDHERKVHTDELDGRIFVTVFRGRDWETYRIEGELPTDLDDLVRAIAARGEEPSGLAVVQLAVIPTPSGMHPALLTSGEARGRRFTRGLLVRTGPDGIRMPHQLVARDHGELGEDGWIGVAPIAEVELFPLGAGEA